MKFNYFVNLVFFQFFMFFIKKVKNYKNAIYNGFYYFCLLYDSCTYII
ncbi:hypothetical protein CNEO4_210028 [Clostridium neonatale]|uniref:Uncharacterized protein n=1 Tax=Clostridium neonatale TaxID=137838 RepID=A0AA86JHC5_9CLOT|nr:hypothetical protein CNEO_240061 [Clostridium neonatale]CAG9708419.1 hypothetical protein CNEO_43617 [Clostridium neonatale]CAG9714726.1 hypothetical protein CNEO_250024 [Clostridium neonatale]CAI3196679.1 hypothetical protein CNEO2_150094 [Clostridium neonatale]CAI3207989.1 hypothetical protein CNEO2_600013 [Clostridium neonatale]